MNWIVYALIIFSLILAFSIGTQDESLATLVGSGSLKLRWAMVLGSILAFFGVLFLSRYVGETIGKDLLGKNVEYTTLMILSIILGMSIWLLVATRTGVPISTTHTVVGAVFGISIIWSITNKEYSFIDAINWGKMGGIALGWIISPILGFFGAWVGQWIINKYFSTRNSGLLEIEKHEKIFRYGIIIFASINQLSRAGNDSANAIGILYSLVKTGNLDSSDLQILIFISAIMLALGLVLIGKNLISSVGKMSGKLRPSEALAIEITVSTILFISTLLGLPVSGGHILIFALIGRAWMNGEYPDKRQFRRMMKNWIITFPMAALISACIYGIGLLF